MADQLDPAIRAEIEGLVEALMHRADEYARLTAEAEETPPGGDLTAEEEAAEDARGEFEDALRDALMFARLAGIGGVNGGGNGN